MVALVLASSWLHPRAWGAVGETRGGRAGEVAPLHKCCSRRNLPAACDVASRATAGGGAVAGATVVSLSGTRYGAAVARLLVHHGARAQHPVHRVGRW